MEPSVPHGIGSPSAPLQALTRFLRLDGDLLAAAAEDDAEAGRATYEASRFGRGRGSVLPEQRRWLLPPPPRSRSCSVRSAALLAVAPRRTGELLGRAAQLHTTRATAGTEETMVITLFFSTEPADSVNALLGSGRAALHSSRRRGLPAIGPRSATQRGRPRRRSIRLAVGVRPACDDDATVAAAPVGRNGR